jgi:hypothetical protein
MTVVTSGTRMLVRVQAVTRASWPHREETVHFPLSIGGQ